MNCSEGNRRDVTPLVAPAQQLLVDGPRFGDPAAFAISMSDRGHERGVVDLVTSKGLIERGDRPPEVFALPPRILPGLCFQRELFVRLPQAE